MLRHVFSIGLVLFLCSCGGGKKASPDSIVGSWRFDPEKSKNYISYLKDGPKTSADMKIVEVTYAAMKGLGFEIEQDTWSSGQGKEYSEPAKYEVVSTKADSVTIKILEGEKKGQTMEYFIDGNHLVIGKGTVSALFFSKK